LIPARAYFRNGRINVATVALQRDYSAGAGISEFTCNSARYIISETASRAVERLTI
jgi:hypothetical protein